MSSLGDVNYDFLDSSQRSRQIINSDVAMIGQTHESLPQTASYAAPRQFQDGTSGNEARRYIQANSNQIANDGSRGGNGAAATGYAQDDEFVGMYHGIRREGV